MRSYSELIQLDTFLERFRYLALKGAVGEPTFGSERYLNQRFYSSVEWRRIREYITVRDDGCDLGVPGHDIHRRRAIHHINPMTPRDIANHEDMILDPENLIMTTHLTHNAIHYGDEQQLPRPLVSRAPGDTTPWRM